MKKNPKHRVIIISLDAMGARDLEYMKTKKHFASLCSKGALCDHVSSVYPTLTYPAHVSIVTGMKPLNHGVINNTCLQPNRPDPDWMWQRKFVKTTTLYDEAIKAGMDNSRSSLACNSKK
jgi:predicted AlkP superfamily pyrophosphatase or phosphodiesterase